MTARVRPGGTVFGSVFTDHMVTIGYRPGEQWHEAKVERFGSLTVSPAVAVLHYGQAIFEGLKAYRAPDDRVLLFRPDANAARFFQSDGRHRPAAWPQRVLLLVVGDHQETALRVVERVDVIDSFAAAAHRTWPRQLHPRFV